MKKTILSYTLFLLGIFIANAQEIQNRDSLNTLNPGPPIDNSVRSESEDEIHSSNPAPEEQENVELPEELSESDQIAQKVAEILEKNKEKKLTTIGYLEVIDPDSIPIENGNAVAIKKGTLKALSINIKEGYMVEIRATVEVEHPNFKEPLSATFRHHWPTSFTNSNTRNWSERKLKSEEANFQNAYIKLSNLLTYQAERTRAYASDTYIVWKAEDGEEPKFEIKRAYDLGNNIEGRIFTGRDNMSQSFGMVQTELSCKFTLMTSNYKSIVPFNHARIKYTANRFDSQFDTIMVDTFTNRINITNAVARAYRQLNFDVSLVHYFNIVHFDFNVGYQLNTTHIDDTSDAVSNSPLNIHNLTLEPTWNLPIVEDRIELAVSPRFLHVFSVNNGPEPRLKKFTSWMFNPEVLLNYFPGDNRTSGIHFRWMLFDNLNRSEDDIMYWQIGYQISFNEVFKQAFVKED